MIHNLNKKTFFFLWWAVLAEGMEKRQELEWDEAQKIDISEDLVATAKQQLRFLAEVDRNRCLYDGPVLERAILRYSLLLHVL